MRAIVTDGNGQSDEGFRADAFLGQLEAHVRAHPAEAPQAYERAARRLRREASRVVLGAILVACALVGRR